MLAVTSGYAGILAIFYVFLSLRVIRARGSMRVALGDGGELMLLRRLRAHGNFGEYVPLAMLLMLLAETQSASRLLLHAIGALLLIGRSIHAFGLSREPEVLYFRVVGMAMTFSSLLIGAAANLYIAAQSFY